MLPPSTPDSSTGTQAAGSETTVILKLDFSVPPKPIAEFAGRPDFPQCVVGEHVDIGGVTGVVVEIVNQSLRVRSSQGGTQSFNFPRLKKIYGPHLRPEFEEPKPPPERPVESSASPVEAAPQAPPRRVLADPNFEQEVKAIRIFAERADFPECVFGEYIDIRGYSGVVVEIVDESLLVRSPDGETRRYNGEVLRKLFGRS